MIKIVKEHNIDSNKTVIDLQIFIDETKMKNHPYIKKFLDELKNTITSCVDKKFNVYPVVVINKYDKITINESKGILNGKE